LTGLSETFQETEILLTGASGFLGKVVLALLLERIPQFNHVHVLLRLGNSSLGTDRFDKDVLASPPLQAIVVHAGKGSLMNRISVWPGDLGAPGCGLSPEISERLAGRVGLIINCAGKVDFLPPIDDSFKSNVDGVENVVALAQQLGAKLLHVSTCFVCGEADGLVEETEPILGFYPQRRSLDDFAFDHREELAHSRQMIGQIYESTPRDQILDPLRRPRDLVQRLITLGRQRAANWGWVNTYTYTKSLGEQIIASTPGLDYAIVRPAIVESAWRFPFPGWIEGGRTAAPLVLMALGGLKDWPVREDAPLEVVPVDMIASAILVIAALLLQGAHEPVYQLGSADSNPIDLGAIVNLLDWEARRRTTNDSFGKVLASWMAGKRVSARPHFVSLEEAQQRQRRSQQTVARRQYWAEGLKTFVAKARLPGASWFEGWASEFRKMDLQAKFRGQTLEQYLPFVLQNRYIFESENIRAAYSKLSERDRALLPWTPEAINWKDYWVNNQIGGIEKWVQPEAARDWKFKL
jgi:long-chain acyl-CoA synthetase